MLKEAVVLVNGQSIDCVSVADRGLAYGDGLFETIAIVAGQPCFWQKHLDRLLRGCNKLGILLDNIAELEKEVFELSQQARSDGVIKIIITRGCSESGYKVHPSNEPLRIVQFQKRKSFSSELYYRGVIACFCKQRLAHNPSLSKIKHLCRLEQVLARMEWQDEYHEGIMFDHQDNAIEGTMSNLFIVVGSSLKTPCLNHCGIQGVMREWVLEQCARHHIEVAETTIDRQAILEADGLFFCNALIRIWPVQCLGTRCYDIKHVQRLLKRFTLSEINIMQ